MPWNVSDVMNERMRFMVRLEQGESMAAVCREWGIARKTGYKFLARFRAEGAAGLADQSRAPTVRPAKTPLVIEERIVATKHTFRTWGPDKLHAYLTRREPAVRWPSAKTFYTILARHQLVHPHRRRGPQHTVWQTPPRETTAPNELWCIDFKGQCRVGTGAWCYPLTLTDHYSRWCLCCEAYERIATPDVIAACTRVFREVGLPVAIRSDNGAPFGARALFGLSRLAVWWLKLGLHLERITPGHPEENGRHERFHRTLKADTTRPAAANLLQQQARFDRFCPHYNTERPHAALGNAPPASRYQPSPRPFPAVLPTPTYPLHDYVVPVTRYGAFSLRHRPRAIYLGHAFAGEVLGVREEDAGLWRVSFLQYDLGYVDEASGHFTPNPLVAW